MNSIFYDLETTSKHTIGQILNYCFTLVDEKLNPIREVAGKVRLSRLELPSPGAILANRTDVVEHQATVSDTEPVAMRRIADFIGESLREGQPVNFIGYNSSRFDLKYLRTSFVRNGINPYFGGRLVYRDLLHVARTLAATDDRFPQVAVEDKRSATGGKRLSLSLENLARACGVLSGPQAHEARADVHITVALARFFRDSFGLDVTRYRGYELLKFHERPRMGDVVGMIYPNYDPTPGAPRRIVTPFTLLEGNDRSALWVDLNRYREGAGRGAIRWFNPGTGWLAAERYDADEEQLALAQQALEEFRSITLMNYFSEKTCDIEEYIYRLKPAGIDALGRAIEHGDGASVQNVEDARILFLRHRLAYFDGGNGDPRGVEWFDKMLKKYALHRYGGGLVIDGADGGESSEGHHHPTLQALVAELDSYRAAAGPGSDDETLLSSLRSFYERSDIVRVAGPELGFAPS